MVDDEELAFLSSYIQEYRDHCLKHDNSMLLRIAGLYRIQMHRFQRVYSFLVMYNAAPFPSFCKYDLKGSTSGRRERKMPEQNTMNDTSLTSQWDGKGQPGTLLDLDFEQDSNEFGRPVEVQLVDKEAMMEQIWLDVHFFASMNVMDYSMLLCRGKCGVNEKPRGVHPLHAVASTREGECFYFSFIDISQRYTPKKAWETFAKVKVLCKDRYSVSSSPAGYYGKRFVERMNMYIKPELPAEHPFMKRHNSFKWNQYDKSSYC